MRSDTLETLRSVTERVEFLEAAESAFFALALRLMGLTPQERFLKVRSPRDGEPVQPFLLGFDSLLDTLGVDPWEVYREACRMNRFMVPEPGRTGAPDRPSWQDFGHDLPAGEVATVHFLLYAALRVHGRTRNSDL